MIFISTRKNINILRIQNESSRSIRFQVRLFSWKQTPLGRFLLRPSEDLVYFPRLLTLPGNKTRIIRIGTESPFTKVEKTYRLLVRELPSSTSPGNAVRLLLNISVPVFILPEKQILNGKITYFNLHHRIFSFTFVNHGTVYYVPQNIKVTGLAKNGKPIFYQNITGWYVLPNETREYQVKIPYSKCGKIKVITVKAQTLHMMMKGRRLNKPDNVQSVLEASYPVQAGGCLP